MTPMPVVCDNCHRLWITESVIGVGSGSSMHAMMLENKVGPCPYCKGMGSIPDGVYQLGEDTAEYLGRLDRDQLQALLRIVTRARDKNLEPDAFAEQVEAELPNASALREFAGQGGAAFRDCLAILIALIGLLLPLVRDKPLTQEQTKQAFVQALEQVQAETRKAAPKLPAQEHPGVGRNDPCWCGSGKKYKKCHGA